jgi:uncharacterized LabA/DUF88 family protein
MSSENNTKTENIERVIAYVDGFNLYFGICSRRWRRYLWLNIQEMAHRLLIKNQVLQRTKYFTARVRNKPDKEKRQKIYLEALETLDDFDIFYGKYLINKQNCNSCGASWYVPSEKMTDVNISVEMLVDAYQDRFDTALLVSADSDLTGPLKAIRALFPQKRIVVAFPPARSSWDLQQVAHAFFPIGQSKIRKSLFPDSIKKPDGYILKRPREWK